MGVKEIVDALDVEQLTTEERRNYIEYLNRYQNYFSKSIRYYEKKRRNQEITLKTQARVQKYYDFMKELVQKCTPAYDDGQLEKSIESLTGVAATNQTLAGLGGGQLTGGRPLPSDRSQTGGGAGMAGGGAPHLPILSNVLNLVKGQNKTDKEINEQLLLMLQTTIGMLEKLNVSEEEISNALLKTIQAISEIKNKYGDDIDEETLAKLVQDECANKIVSDLKQ